MKSFALLSACTALSLLASCDSGSSPTQVEVQTKHDTILLNDRFARNAKVVHGRWTIKSSTDTADTWIFQDSSKATALVQWGKSSSWTVEGTPTSNGWDLLSADGKIELLLKITEEKDLKVNKMTINVINRNNSDLFTATAERRL